MKKKIFLSLIIFSILLFTAACEIINPPSPPKPVLPTATRKPTRTPEQVLPTPLPSVVPTDEQATPTQEPAVPTQEAILTPEPATEFASTRMQDDIWFTYNADLWRSSGDSSFPHLLSTRYPECRIYLNNGHGMGDIFTYEANELTIEGLLFTVSTWSYVGTEAVALKGYTWEDSFFFSIENPDASGLSPQCLVESEEVLRQSIRHGFDPVTGPQEASDVYPPVVYSKDGNIYAYFIESDNIIAVTEGGGEWEGEELPRYFHPRVSPNGLYVAYQRIDKGQVLVYSFETCRIWSLDINEPEESYSDKIVGWDKHNILYINRVIGECRYMEGEDGTPEHSYVMRFVINEEDLQYVTDLPVMDSSADSHSIGVDISPSGRFLTYRATYCQPVWPQKEYVYDLQTGAIHDYGMAGYTSLSNQEDRLAYPSKELFEQTNNIYVVISALEGNTGAFLNGMDDTSTVWSAPDWSFDDRYLVMEQRPINIPHMKKYDAGIWWELGSGGIVMVDTQDIEEPYLTLTDLDSENGDWAFGAWSPQDYRMVLLWRGEIDEETNEYASILWMFEPFTNTAFIIDQGLHIEGVDW
jgi:hypothetical protein